MDEVLPFTVTEEEKASGDLPELSPGEHPPEGVVHTEGGRDGRQLEIWDTPAMESLSPLHFPVL